MKIHTIRTIFRDGVFHPVEPISAPLHNGQKVDITMQTVAEATDDDSAARVERILALLADFYEGLSPEEIGEMEAAMRRQPDFFGVHLYA